MNEDSDNQFDDPALCFEAKPGRVIGSLVLTFFLFLFSPKSEEKKTCTYNKNFKNLCFDVQLTLKFLSHN